MDGENQIRSPSPKQNPGWIVSPLFDLCFFANIWWLVLGLPWWLPELDSPLKFWQVYFLTTPHRWVTLLIVVADPDRREGRTKLFVGIAVFFAAVVCGLRWSTGAFFCVASIDFIWNAWHFGSQHGGILRIYSRKIGGGRPLVETYVTRFFVAYCILRTAGWTQQWEAAYESVSMLVLVMDIVMVIVMSWLLITEALEGLRSQAGISQRLGKVVYLCSVLALYTCLLFAMRTRQSAWLVLLLPAHAAFHATEYLAVVSYYASRRSDHGSDGLFREMARNWAFTLVSLVVFLGTFSHFISNYASQFWIGLNLWVAFLHYGYDGLIWKLRRPKTAATLGVE